MFTFAAATKATSTIAIRAPAQSRVDHFVAITCSDPKDSCDLYNDACRTLTQLVSPSRDPIGLRDGFNTYRNNFGQSQLDPNGKLAGPCIATAIVVTGVVLVAVTVEMVVIDTIGDVIAGPSPEPTPSPRKLPPKKLKPFRRVSPQDVPRTKPTSPDSTGNGNCYLTSAMSPVEGGKCWMCTYFCPQGHRPFPIVRWQRNGCHSDSDVVEGWPDRPIGPKFPEHPEDDKEKREGHDFCEGSEDGSPMPGGGVWE